MNTEWANCATPGCANKVCIWGSDSLCYPHEERIVGKTEMDRRYDATHERPWSAPQIEGKPNFMLGTFEDIRDD